MHLRVYHCVAVVFCDDSFELESAGEMAGVPKNVLQLCK